jgi:DHA3 family tetracycline resistance protein-like MFS transporter
MCDSLMKKLPAERIYYTRCAVWEFNSGLIFTSIWVLIYSVMKLSLFEVSLLYIVITLSNLALEIPTGILADLYSRRLSVIVGGFFIGLAYVTVGAYPIFAISLFTGFLEAIGDTCVSGALQAWITDEVGTDRVGKVLLRGRQVGIPAHWVGVLLSIALAARWNIQVPIVLGGAMWFVLTIFLILFMPETNFQRSDASSPQGRAPLWSQWGVTLKTFADGMRLVRGSQILLLLFLAQLFGSIFFDSFYKFSRANILQGFALPVLALPILGVLKENAWFGMLEMLQGLFCLLGMEGVRRWANLNRAGMAARILLGFTVLMLVGLGVFAWTGNFALAILAWLVVSSLQEIGNPVSETWLNQHIPSNIRATVLSINSQVGMFGRMGGSTALGLFGDRFGVRRALGLSGAFLVPLLIIYRKQSTPTTGHTKNEPLTQA